MPERWRSAAARELAALVREAGGTIERAGKGKLKVTGPDGTITIYELAGETRRDLRRDSVVTKIAKATGLEFGGDDD